MHSALNVSAPSFKTKKADHRNYHLIDFGDLRKGIAKKADCVEEVNRRVKFAHQYYRGKFDEKHKNVISWIAKDFTVTDKLNLTLDSLVVLQKSNR
jgi:hypothetical protein